MLRSSNQLKKKNKFMFHKNIIDKLENNKGFHILSIQQLNKIFHSSSELLDQFIIRRINE